MSQGCSLANLRLYMPNEYRYYRGSLGTREPSCLENSVQSARSGHLAVQAGHLQKQPGERSPWLWLSEADDASTRLTALL